MGPLTFWRANVLNHAYSLIIVVLPENIVILRLGMAGFFGHVVVNCLGVRMRRCNSHCVSKVRTYAVGGRVWRGCAGYWRTAARMRPALASHPPTPATSRRCSGRRQARGARPM